MAAAPGVVAVRPAVFLDRDGTLVVEKGYLCRPGDVELIPGVGRALRELAEAGFLRVVVTNQSGVARGYFGRHAVAEVHEAIRRLLRARGADVDAWYVCPHHPAFTGPCGCRKPETGLLDRAARDLGIDLARSWVVGDKVSDVELARRAGCRAALVRTGYGRRTEAELAASGRLPEVVADHLEEAVKRILAWDGLAPGSLTGG